MTVGEVIARVDELKLNQYGRKEKIGWLSTLDGLMVREVLAWHEGIDEDVLAFAGYGEEDLEAELVVPFPYAELYDHYLMAQIDYMNGEMDHYNNCMVMYNMAVARYADWVNRTYRPIQGDGVRTSVT